MVDKELEKATKTELRLRRYATSLGYDFLEELIEKLNSLWTEIYTVLPPNFKIEKKQLVTDREEVSLKIKRMIASINVKKISLGEITNLANEAYKIRSTYITDLPDTWGKKNAALDIINKFLKEKGIDDLEALKIAYLKCVLSILWVTMAELINLCDLMKEDWDMKIDELNRKYRNVPDPLSAIRCIEIYGGPKKNIK